MGGQYLRNVGVVVIVDLWDDGVGRVFRYLEGVQSFRGSWESCGLHLCELVFNGHGNGGLEVYFVG